MRCILLVVFISIASTQVLVANGTILLNLLHHLAEHVSQHELPSRNNNVNTNTNINTNVNINVNARRSLNDNDHKVNHRRMITDVETFLRQLKHMVEHYAEELSTNKKENYLIQDQLERILIVEIVLYKFLEVDSRGNKTCAKETTPPAVVKEVITGDVSRRFISAPDSTNVFNEAAATLYLIDPLPELNAAMEMFNPITLADDFFRRSLPPGQIRPPPSPGFYNIQGQTINPVQPGRNIFRYPQPIYAPSPIDFRPTYGIFPSRNQVPWPNREQFTRFPASPVVEGLNNVQGISEQNHYPYEIISDSQIHQNGTHDNGESVISTTAYPAELAHAESTEEIITEPQPIVLDPVVTSPLPLPILIENLLMTRPALSTNSSAKNASAKHSLDSDTHTSNLEDITEDLHEIKYARRALNIDAASTTPLVENHHQRAKLTTIRRKHPEELAVNNPSTTEHFFVPSNAVPADRTKRPATAAETLCEETVAGRKCVTGILLDKDMLSVLSKSEYDAYGAEWLRFVDARDFVEYHPVAAQDTRRMYLLPRKILWKRPRVGQQARVGYLRPDQDVDYFEPYD